MVTALLRIIIWRPSGNPSRDQSSFGVRDGQVPGYPGHYAVGRDTSQDYSAFGTKPHFVKAVQNTSNEWHPPGESFQTYEDAGKIDAGCGKILALLSCRFSHLPPFPSSDINKVRVPFRIRDHIDLYYSMDSRLFVAWAFVLLFKLLCLFCSNNFTSDECTFDKTFAASAEAKGGTSETLLVLVDSAS